MTTKNKDYDVIIIGAGFAGLSAALTILDHDDTLSIAIIEAKGRIGGRTFAQEIKTEYGVETWDLGGQWVGSSQTHVMKLLERLGISVYEQFIEGRKVMQLGGNKVSTYSSDIPSLPFYSLIELHFLLRKIEKMRKQIPMHDPSMCMYAAEWDSITVRQALNQWCWFSGTRESLESASRCMFGVELEHMSLLYYLMYVQAAGGIEPLISAKPGMGQQYRISGGAYNVCGLLADKIGREKILLDSPVMQINQSDTLVNITTLGGKTLSCDRAILALPPHQAVRIEYQPSLPVEKLHVLQNMPVGYLTKIIVTYKTAFWRERGFSGEAVTNGGPTVVSDCSTGPLNIVYDATSERGSPAIVAFIGGKQQLEYTTLRPVERKRAVLASLAQLLGAEAQDYIGYAEKNWNEEPYNGGCPVSVASPGVVSYIAPGLRYPHHRVHFAGTESATVWCGFLNGAVQSGQRAAYEVLHNLRPQSMTSEQLRGTFYDTHLFEEPTASRNYVCYWVVPGVLVSMGLVYCAYKVYSNSK